MASFVVKIAPLQIDDFEIIINTSSSEYPTAEQMALVGPHITSSPNIKISDDISRCEACHNRIIYSPSPPSGNDQSVVFSRLMCLGVKLCCASSAVYDYADFTAARFPRIETVGITISNCGRDTMSTDPAFVHPVLSQYWPNVSTMELYGNATSSALYTILDRNPQITDLNVEISSSGTDIDQSSHFSLADIVKRLPSLDTLGIVLNIYNKLYGNSADDIGNNEDSDLSFIKNSRLKDIHIYFVTMTSDCLEMLYMLPKLEKLTIMECNLDNQQAALEKINRIQQLNSTMESGKYGANIQHIEFEKVGLKGYGYWPAELVIAMMAAAPNIKSVEFDKVTSELFSAITKRFPNVKSKYRIISDYDSDAECSDYSDFSDVSDGESSDDYESDDQITI
ncbi:hypothetical protein GQ42DRAFT_10420 [Ramicandelaber brevisporus]|nr:hypothetical protein GQ42DRAFT_10420 [Ramicandelaber brevisporus]